VLRLHYSGGQFSAAAQHGQCCPLSVMSSEVQHKDRSVQHDSVVICSLVVYGAWMRAAAHSTSGGTMQLGQQ
jgi:hypothetical protein